MTPGTGPSAGPADRKSVLFCPACEYEAPLDANWAHDDRHGVDSGRTDVTCPECGQVVASQPQYAGFDDASVTDVVRPFSELLHAVVRHDVL